MRRLVSLRFIFGEMLDAKDVRDPGPMSLGARDRGLPETTQVCDAPSTNLRETSWIVPLDLRKRPATNRADRK